MGKHFLIICFPQDTLPHTIQSTLSDVWDETIIQGMYQLQATFEIENSML